MEVRVEEIKPVGEGQAAVRVFFSGNGPRSDDAELRVYVYVDTREKTLEQIEAAAIERVSQALDAAKDTLRRRG